MGRKGLFLGVFALAALLSGCTGTRMTVLPDLGGEPTTYAGPCGTVAVRESTPDRVYPPAGNPVPGFADALRESGLAKTVYYPSRPDDKVDYVMDAKFDVLFHPNMGSNLTKSFVTGLTLFLLEPVFWFDYDYSLTGEVSLYHGPVKVAVVRGSTESEMGMKFLSLGEAVNLEGETLSQSKKNLYRQLLQKLEKHCSQAR